MFIYVFIYIKTLSNVLAEVLSSTREDHLILDKNLFHKQIHTQIFLKVTYNQQLLWQLPLLHSSEYQEQ